MPFLTTLPFDWPDETRVASVVASSWSEFETTDPSLLALALFEWTSADLGSETK